MAQQFKIHFGNGLSEFGLQSGGRPLSHYSIPSPLESLTERSVSSLLEPIQLTLETLTTESKWTRRQSEQLRESFSRGLISQLLNLNEQPVKLRYHLSKRIIGLVSNFCRFADAQDSYLRGSHISGHSLLRWVTIANTPRPYAGQVVKGGIKLQLNPDTSLEPALKFAAANHTLFRNRQRYYELSEFLPEDCFFLSPPAREHNSFSFVLNRNSEIDSIDFMDELKQAGYQQISGKDSPVSSDIICYRMKYNDLSVSHTAMVVAQGVVVSRWGRSGPVLLHKINQLHPSLMNPVSDGRWQIYRKSPAQI